MTIQLGYNSFIGVGVTTGTALVATAATEWIFFNSATFVRDQNIAQATEMGCGGRAYKRMQFGNVTASGQFTKHVDEHNGIGMYRFLLGGTVTVASVASYTTVYTHTFSEGNETPNNTNPERLFFEVQMGGNSATTRCWGVGLPDSYSLSARTGELVTENWNFKLQDHTAVRNTVTAATFTQVNPMISTKAFVKLGITITATSITNATDFTLNINNNILENRNLGTNTVSIFQYGNRQVTGSFNMMFENYDQYNNFVNNTSLAMQLVLNGEAATSGTTHNITWNLPEIYYTGAHPTLNDSGQIVQPINFVANYSSNASYQIKCVVTNNLTATVF
jgi:hypothetical protein